MARTLLSDEVWNKVRDILPGKEGDRGRTASSNRWFLEAVLWIARTGSPWRDQNQSQNSIRGADQPELSRLVALNG